MANKMIKNMHLDTLRNIPNQQQMQSTTPLLSGNNNGNTGNTGNNNYRYQQYLNKEYSIKENIGIIYEPYKNNNNSNHTSI